MLDTEAKAPGRAAYEEDCRRCPNYHDGTERHTWAQLGTAIQGTWHRNPTPRDHALRAAP